MLRNYAKRKKSWVLVKEKDEGYCENYDDYDEVITF
jgi:hypothetical protein